MGSTYGRGRGHPTLSTPPTPAMHLSLTMGSGGQQYSLPGSPRKSDMGGAGARLVRQWEATTGLSAKVKGRPAGRAGRPGAAQEGWHWHWAGGLKQRRVHPPAHLGARL